MIKESPCIYYIYKLITAVTICIIILLILLILYCQNNVTIVTCVDPEHIYEGGGYVIQYLYRI